MEAGRLRHRITIDEPVTTQGSTGEELITWTAFQTVWGSIEPLSGRERLLATQITAELDTRIRIRWSSAISVMTAKWRLRHQAVIYNIVTIANVEMRNRELEIMCSSGVNEG